jgi:hypothetical protein
VRPSRSIALFALVALVLLRGVGLAADAWTANAVECCCGRHAADHDCGCDQCPSHHHDGKHADDHASHLRACAHHADLVAPGELPDALTPPAAEPPPAARAILVIAPPLAPPESRLVHPETPPS